MQPARPPRGLLANTGNTSDDMPAAFKTRKTSRRVTIPIFSAFLYTQKGSDRHFFTPIPCTSPLSTWLHSGCLNSWHAFFIWVSTIHQLSIFFIAMPLLNQFENPMRWLSPTVDPLSTEAYGLHPVTFNWIMSSISENHQYESMAD